MRAKQPIEHRESFLSVPYKMLLTCERAQSHPVLQQVIEENPHLFDEDQKGDAEQLILVLCLLYEYMQGENSFWKPYIDLMPDVKFFCHWPSEIVTEAQDANLANNVANFKTDMEQEWLDLEQVLAVYPDIFAPGSVTQDLFLKFYGQVCTRCFGWGLPSTSMIPMADNINHADVNVVQEIINTELHMTAEPGQDYFTRTKMMNDYTINFSPEQYEDDPVAKFNVKGRHNRANFNANLQFESIQSVKEYMATGVKIWDVPCIKDFYKEDNDTEEEDEGTEEELKENAPMLDALSTFIKDRRANMSDMHKGFIFFIEQEKLEIKRAKAAFKARKRLGLDQDDQT